MSINRAPSLFDPIKFLFKNKRKPALQNVSFSIKEGERVGVIGVNGAGKSTLLKLIAGIADQTSGSLEIAGEVHAVLTLGVGLQEELTGRENLYLEAEVHNKNLREIDPIIEDIYRI